MFGMYRQRFKYWSHSDIAKSVHKWLGAPKSPVAETWEGWEKYHNSVKPYKLAYWLDKTGWDGLQNIVYFPYDVYTELGYAVKTRFLHKRHLLQSELPKWRYHDYRELLLHATFDSWVNDFLIGEKGDGTKAGLFKHWEWEQNITNKDYEYYGDDPEHAPEELIPQAIFARKEEELYRWWMIRRHQIMSGYYVGYEDDIKLNDIDNEKLKELIDMRLHMWT